MYINTFGKCGSETLGTSHSSIFHSGNEKKRKGVNKKIILWVKSASTQR